MATPPPPPQETWPTFWTQWNNQVMLRYLMSHNLPPPRQTPETWEALLKLRLPQGDLRFIQTALWRKLKLVRIPIGCSVLFLSDFRNFSDFGYNFRRIPKLYYL